MSQVEPTASLAELVTEQDESPAAAGEDRDWHQANPAELCDQIVSVHQEGPRGAVPRIAELLATVVRVHGGGRPELAKTQRAFAALRAELALRLEEEEEKKNVIEPSSTTICAGGRTRRVGQGPGSRPCPGGGEELDDAQARSETEIVLASEVRLIFSPVCGDNHRLAERAIHECLVVESIAGAPRSTGLSMPLGGRT